MAPDCAAPLFLMIVVGAAAAAFAISGVAIVAYGLMKRTLLEYGEFMPFRAVESRILNWMVWIFTGAQVYYAVSVVLQVVSGRPVCNDRWDGWTYYLSWTDWLMMLALVIWPAVCQLVLLYSVNGSVEDVRLGKPQRKPGWLPEHFRHPTDVEMLEILEEIRASVKDASSVDGQALLARVEEIKYDTIREARDAVEEAKREIIEAAKEIKKTAEEFQGVQAQHEKKD